MTAVLDATPDADEGDTAPPEPTAAWHARAGAFALDVLVGLAVVATMALLSLSAPLFGRLWWMFTGLAVLSVIAVAINRWLAPTWNGGFGWSLGRAVFGVRVVRRDGAAVGVGRLALRDLAHLLDTVALFVGWLWPLWDRRRRTFADLLLRTEVRPAQRPERDVRRLAGKVLAGAVVISALAVLASFLLVYRHQEAIDQARQQIAEQGPRIVEQMLSYSTDTIDDDFRRAQSLTTDAYRPQLVAQQDAVRKSGATTNEYWAVTSAVLPDPPVSNDRAAMLLAMQGQRGIKVEDLKFITATVRVDFDKVGDQWRINNLTVLKKPLMQAGGQ